MAENVSENKVRVTHLLGSEAIVGWMHPEVHMRVHIGIDTRWITALDSGNFQVSLAKSSGGTAVQKAYPHQLVIDAPVASGFGWPTIDGCVVFGHNSGIRASGLPVADDSSLVYLKGGGPVTTFTR